MALLLFLDALFSNPDRSADKKVALIVIKCIIFRNSVLKTRNTDAGREKGKERRGEN